ncbi:hypothetical protein DT73_00385 [Mangrovibacter sp. MFB070]|uniref:hypothetical protein n=1 Tax=Mangrovibacter sp. MFB070 TaxID=1224318 RepID=UPI0004D97FF0|nr:hypothetical protein [Mangrovibacter sp. MFB070]KEA54655.1 hypothetical protein DT73_00385 [Mangrovibacter sp. MFB070]
MSAEIKAAIIVSLFLLIVGTSCFVGYQYQSNSNRAETAETQVSLQATVIQTQAIQLAAFNALASDTSSKNNAATTASDNTVIEYRTILKREKTCDMPVPADIAGGLLKYANRLRSGAVSATSNVTDSTGSGTTTTSELTYCQAVLWINPLLTALEQANNQLSAIRLAEQKRQETTK